MRACERACVCVFVCGDNSWSLPLQAYLEAYYKQHHRPPSEYQLLLCVLQVRPQAGRPARRCRSVVARAESWSFHGRQQGVWVPLLLLAMVLLLLSLQLLVLLVLAALLVLVVVVVLLLLLLLATVFGGGAAVAVARVGGGAAASVGVVVAVAVAVAAAAGCSPGWRCWWRSRAPAPSVHLSTANQPTAAPLAAEMKLKLKLKQLLRVLAVLEENRIVHRDLKVSG
jgi:hypothetical protein